jgi:predicted small secreted protein
MKKTFSMALAVSILFSFLGLTGCENTVRGFGQDMQHAGKEIQKSTN